MNPDYSAYETAKSNLVVLLPEILILLAAVVMMTAGAFVRWPRRHWAAISAGVLVVGLAALLATRNAGIGVDIYSAVVLGDSFAFYSRLFLLLSGLILLGMAHDQVDDNRAPEFFGCLLMIHAGAMLVSAANELVFMFVALELVSIPTYLLLYLPRRTGTTQEAATKYFYLSIFSSGLLLYGMAFLYGLFGVSNLKALTFLANYAPQGIQQQLGLVAGVFIVAGLGFRVAAVPFHFYAPDVYQGSPTVVTAMLAWIPKGIGFLAMIRMLTSVFAAAQIENPVVEKLATLGWVIAAATMILGNTVALRQEDLKRLFAYSSIAHAGYLMIGVVAAFYNTLQAGVPQNYLGAEGILFYLVAYALMTLGAFAVLLAVNAYGAKAETVSDLAGLGRSRPLLALAMAICLFSLAGIPPLAGFWGKFELFAAALAAGRYDPSSSMFWLVVLAVLNSAAGAYYYLRIVVTMYLRPEPAEAPAATASRLPWPTAAAVAVCAGFSVLFGLLPAPVAQASRDAAIASMVHPDPDTPARPVALSPTADDARAE